MAGISNYSENKILNWMTGTSAGTSPTLYVSLSTTAYADDGTGGTELSGSGYARATPVFGSSIAGTPSGRRIQNTSTTSFPVATGSLGTPGYFGVFDASSAGNLLFSGIITSPITLSNQITEQFAAGTFYLNMSGMSQYLANKYLAWLTGTSMGSSPGGVYMALSSTAIADDGTGGTEVSGNGYARAQTTLGSTAAGSPSGRTISNSSITAFPLTTGSGWGSPAYAGAYDASTTGNLLWPGTISPAVALSQANLTPQYAVGALTFTADLTSF